MTPVFDKTVLVEFSYQPEADDRYKIVKVELVFRDWTWILDCSSFEVVHGISRVMKLVPDKLVTARSINRGNLPDPDDGSFFIKLIVDLVKYYIDCPRRRRNEILANDINFETLLVEIGSDDHPIGGDDLSDVLELYFEKLQLLQNLLRDRKIDEFDAEAEQLLRLSDDILTACQVPKCTLSVN